MLKTLKQFTAWLDGVSEADLEEERKELIKEQQVIIARLEAENKDLRARNRELLKRK